MNIKKIVNLILGIHPNNTVFSWNFLFTRKNIVWLKKYNSLLENSDIIDYGCGKCPYFPYLEPFTSNYYALDFHFNEQVNQNKIKQVCLDSNGGIPDIVPKVDVILSLQVVVEVEDLDYYFSQINNKSKLGTRLFITSPWGMSATGYNDRFRISPYAIVSFLQRYGYEVIHYDSSGYFFSSMGLSLNLLLITENEYDIYNSKVIFSKIKTVIFTPLIFVVNLLSLCLDKLFPLKKSPANWILIAKKIR